MSDFRAALDFIDLHLSDDNVLRQRVQQWRYLLGQWKSHLSNDISYISYVIRVLLRRNRLDRESILSNDPTTEGSGTSRTLLTGSWNRLDSENVHLNDPATESTRKGENLLNS